MNYVLSKKNPEIGDKGFIVGNRFMTINNSGSIKIPKEGLIFYAPLNKNVNNVIDKKIETISNNVSFEDNQAYFNGNDSSIVWKNVLNQELSDFTMFVKFNHQNTSGNWKFICGMSSSEYRNDGCSIQLNVSNSQQLTVNLAGSDYQYLNDCNINNDYIVTLKRTNGRYSVYLNGVVLNNSIANISQNIPTSALVYVGGDFGQVQQYRHYYKGYMSNFIIYNIALSDEMISNVIDKM